MMLPRVPGKERAQFVLKMFAGMMEHGTAGMSDEEFMEFKGRLQDILDQARPGEAVEVNGVELAPGGG
jgi:hypothetical protein